MPTKPLTGEVTTLGDHAKNAVGWLGLAALAAAFAVCNASFYTPRVSNLAPGAHFESQQEPLSEAGLKILGFAGLLLLAAAGFPSSRKLGTAGLVVLAVVVVVLFFEWAGTCDCVM